MYAAEGERDTDIEEVMQVHRMSIGVLIIDRADAGHILLRFLFDTLPGLGGAPLVVVLILVSRR